MASRDVPRGRATDGWTRKFGGRGESAAWQVLGWLARRRESSLTGECSSQCRVRMEKGWRIKTSFGTFWRLWLESSYRGKVLRGYNKLTPEVKKTHCNFIGLHKMVKELRLQNR